MSSSKILEFFQQHKKILLQRFCDTWPMVPLLADAERKKNTNESWAVSSYVEPRRDDGRVCWRAEFQWKCSTIENLINFRDKYQYILTTIPISELPGPQTMYNHLMDEFERCTVLATKITKSREAPAGLSAMGITESNGFELLTIWWIYSGMASKSAPWRSHSQVQDGGESASNLPLRSQVWT